MCLSTSCIHLVSYVGFPPLASPQLLAFMLFQYPNFSCTPVPLSNFLHAFGFNISASPISQQLLALIWFQYLTSPLCLSSNFLNFLHSLGFNIYTLQGVQRPSPCDTLGFPPPSHIHLRCPSTTSCIHLNSYVAPPVASPQILASILFQYSKALTHLCLSATSCIRAVSISRLLPLVSPQLLACIVIGVQYLGTHNMIFEYLYFPPGPSLSTNLLRSSCFNI